MTMSRSVPEVWTAWGVQLICTMRVAAARKAPRKQPRSPLAGAASLGVATSSFGFFRFCPVANCMHQHRVRS